MAQVAAQSPVIAGIDAAIADIERKIRDQQATGAAPGGVSRSGGVALPPAAPGAPASQAPSAEQSIEDMSLFLSRLRQIRDWLQQDNRLMPVVDGFIGQKVTASEQRSNRLNIILAAITTVIGAVLGWLASGFGAPPHFLP
jgi:hypothetical protein